MKKIWLLSFIFIITIHSSHAQRIRFAIFADPLISWMKTDVSKITSDGDRFGMNIGLMMDKYFAEHYAFSSGISIRSMGGTLKYKDGKNVFQNSGDVHELSPNTSVKYKLQYIHIPLAIKLRTVEIGYTTYFAQVGLDPMINIKSSADISSLGITNVGVGREINPIYMAYHIGAGIEYKIVGSTSLMAGLTYMNGFTDVTDNNGNSNEKTVIHSFELRIGIIF
jgi:hypothetical protein